MLWKLLLLFRCCILLLDTSSVRAFCSSPPVHSARRDNTVVATLLEAVSWMDRARQLYVFQQRHGHTRVPRRYSQSPGLGVWVHKQRQSYRDQTLSPERASILQQLDIDAPAATTPSDKERDEEWWDMYRQLRAQINHNHTTLANVPRQSRLGQWLYTQQQPASATHLDAAQSNALQQLDPQWRDNRQERNWRARYEQLVEYKLQHGHCCVPISHAPNPALAHWVSNQRKRYNVGTLSDERTRCLNQIGFVWKRWEYGFAQKNRKIE